MGDDCEIDDAVFGLSPDLVFEGKIFFLERTLVEFVEESVSGSLKIYFWDLPFLHLVSGVRLCWSPATLLTVDSPSLGPCSTSEVGDFCPSVLLVTLRICSSTHYTFLPRWSSTVFLKSICVTQNSFVGFSALERT
ncbi:GPR22 [Lepeophtheirus salmonis]|uniref:GPR22 n=1 Tax=Lepeophtheirus salmonis TaxID=72036 RepID=A0A7R8HD86_LEPSM|nr:GPR22 [Lepeophtheirus salmonis]CAF3005048.1 GPR22 [Lepeophtheirus salmonis]